MRQIWFGLLSLGCAGGALFLGCGDQPQEPTGPASSSSSAASSGSGSGGSAGCTTAMDCPGQDTPCRKITCTDGTCGTSDVPMGMDSTTQTAGDCKKIVCDGM